MSNSHDTAVTKEIERFIRVRPVTGRVLLAVSGGPDSMAMLQAFTQCYDRDQLVVGHFNHRLRGAASEADAALVQRVCQEVGIAFELGSSETLRPEQVGLEAEARKLRYQWLRNTAERLQCSWIMTGHTLNDQAETVLHHMVRGTGWRGMRGIASRKYLNDALKLGRPLLRCTKAQVLEYLASQQARYCDDASNSDVKFTRNRLRHRVMPELLSINPQAVQHLARWAQVARREYQKVHSAGKAMLAEVLAHRERDAASLYVVELERLDDEILQEVLRRLWHLQDWPADAMNRARWREVMEVCQGKRVAVELPGRVMVRRRLGVVQIEVL
jgi:tRNA(Ile)-lysidine synthase